MSDKKRHNGEKGYCIAGLDSSGNWVRLVANKSGDSIDKEKVDMKPLDIYDVKTKVAPIKHQPENNVLDGYKRTCHVSETPTFRGAIRRALCKKKYLFQNDNYYIKLSDHSDKDGSLLVAEVSGLKVRQVAGKTKCEFDYNGVHYDYMSVTDPNFYGDYKVGNAYVVISTPTESDYVKETGQMFKFVAAIYPLSSNKYI
jgi:hypothetical protein